MNLLLIFLITQLSLAQSQPLVPTQDFLSDEAYSSFFLGKKFGGGDSIGGGDNVDIRRFTAWFYGNKPIDVCYQLSDFFGVDSTRVEISIKEVIKVWTDYFDKKKIGQNLEFAKRINTHFNLKQKCEGGEDLVLYFGTGPIFGNLDDLRARQMLSRPVAYVNKTHISQDLNWAKGYIRFVEPEIYFFRDQLYFPDWSKGFSFYNLLLHEFGHVLGFEHKDGTIMRKEISLDNFINDSSHSEKSDIEQSKELIYCSDCETIYHNKWTKINGLESIKIKNQKKIEVLIDKNFVPIIVKHSLNRESNITLLSFNDYKSYEESPPYFYFVEINGIHYTLELENNVINMRLNGELVALFDRERS